jgi:hypothetical protein
MKIRRRDLFKWSLVQIFAFSISMKSKAHPFASAPFLKKSPSILQGATDESKTQFSILYEANVPLNIFVTNSLGNVFPPDHIQGHSFPKHPKKITKAFFSGLSPDETYFLVVQNAMTNVCLDKREFQTLNLSDDNLCFALCSCMDDQRHEPEIWKDIAAKKPQMIFFIGDHVYANVGDSKKAGPKQLWKRYCDARLTLQIFFAYRLIPILATWDDHDFGMDNGHSENYPYVKESQVNFKSFFAQDEGHCRFLRLGPGISSAIHWNSQLFVLSDGRSFRQPKHSEDRYAHWGKAQEEWIMSLIRNNNGPTWVMNGSQVFPKMMFKESVCGNHKKQFYGFLKELKTVSSKVIFVSGDVHFSEISEIEEDLIGYKTYEITSSSIHSPCFRGAHHFFANSRRMIATCLRNYILVDSKSQGLGVKMKVTSYDSEGDALFQLNLSV